jgi:hypothetical protein
LRPNPDYSRFILQRGTGNLGNLQNLWRSEVAFSSPAARIDRIV